MFESALSFFTGTEVNQIDLRTIRVLGMKMPPFLYEIDKLWKTSKISGNLFRKVKSRQLDFHPFFAPDFYYVCKRLMGERRARVNRNALQEVIDQLQTNTWMKTAFAETFTPRLNLKALNRLTKDMLPHQNQFLAYYNESVSRWQLKGAILGAAPGSGKTIAAIAVSECLETDITICIVPKNAVERVWHDTLSWIFKEKQPYWYSTSGDELKKGYRYYVAHYEQLDRMVEFFKDPAFKGKKINIVLDESHNLNELKSMRTELFLQLCKIVDCQDVLWTSGTPIKAMGSEVIPILRSIDPFFDQEAEERFRAIFGLSSARGLDILAHRLGYMTFKIDKQQIVGNTVEKYRVDVTLKNGDDYTLANISKEMTKFVKERLDYYRANMKTYIENYQAGLRFYERTLKTSAEVKAFDEYVRTAKLLHTSYDPMVHKTEPIFCNAYEKKFILPALPKELKESFKDSRSVYKYVKLKVQGEALGRILGKKRTQCNVDMLSAWDSYKVTDMQTGEKFDTTLVDIIENSIKKTVVFTSYVEVVDRCAEIIRDEGGFPLKVYGQTNGELPQIVSQFDKDKRSNPLIATLQSLSTAVPLIMANSVVFLNAPFRDHEYEQACSRVDRLGQTEVVQIWDVYLDTGKEPNISTRSLDIMAWSKSQVEAMLGTAGSSVGLEELVDGHEFFGFIDNELSELTQHSVSASRSEPSLVSGEESLDPFHYFSDGAEWVHGGPHVRTHRSVSLSVGAESETVIIAAPTKLSW
ncbi:putative DEAD-like helicase [Ralstonia phage RP31]|uniref:Putative DEAD-like helicase n=2 Tax=Ripduovirus RP12 TaxID=2560700 RepID=A0A1L7N0Z1_9CAUD|nr:putative DEAD-like helicase [Ralstonia phage RP12]BAW19143.1 putative DEAD-like helicase [Ralstonia phage RP12]BAW19429.1 putative DEAD-like helicase [Ralstonia phage RP31]